MRMNIGIHSLVIIGTAMNTEFSIRSKDYWVAVEDLDFYIYEARFFRTYPYYGISNSNP